jgi:hypothetical protein
VVDAATLEAINRKKLREGQIVADYVEDGPSKEHNLVATKKTSEGSMSAEGNPDDLDHREDFKKRSDGTDNPIFV